MRRFNTLIVDDEIEARNGLINFVESDPELIIKSTCANGMDAIDVINQGEVDIVLLDIQMPEINGFEVLASIKNVEIPYVIFITAYDKFALQAFEYHAIDYILKPYSEERLVSSINYIKNRIRLGNWENRQAISKVLDSYFNIATYNKSNLICSAEGPATRTDRIAVKTNGVVHFFSLNEIMYFEAQDNYVKIHLTQSRSFIINNTLKSIQSANLSTYFIRIHKSFIVNLEYIKCIYPGISGDFTIHLQNETQLKGSRNFREVIDNSILGKFNE